MSSTLGAALASSATRALVSATSAIPTHINRHHHSAWHRFGRWVLTGVLVGVFVLTLLLGICIFLCMKRRKSKKTPKPSTGGGTDVTFNKRHNDHGNMVENGYGSHSTYDTTKSMPHNGSTVNTAPAHTTTVPATTVGLAPQNDTTSNGYHVTNGAPEMMQYSGGANGPVQATHGTGAGNNVPAIVQPVARY